MTKIKEEGWYFSGPIDGRKLPVVLSEEEAKKRAKFEIRRKGGWVFASSGEWDSIVFPESLLLVGEYAEGDGLPKIKLPKRIAKEISNYGLDPNLAREGFLKVLLRFSGENQAVAKMGKKGEDLRRAFNVMVERLIKGLWEQMEERRKQRIRKGAMIGGAGLGLSTLISGVSVVGAKAQEDFPPDVPKSHVYEIDSEHPAVNAYETLEKAKSRRRNDGEWGMVGDARVEGVGGAMFEEVLQVQKELAIPVSEVVDGWSPRERAWMRFERITEEFDFEGWEWTEKGREDRGYDEGSNYPLDAESLKDFLDVFVLPDADQRLKASGLDLDVVSRNVLRVLSENGGRNLWSGVNVVALEALLRKCNYDYYLVPGQKIKLVEVDGGYRSNYSEFRESVKKGSLERILALSLGGDPEEFKMRMIVVEPDGDVVDVEDKNYDFIERLGNILEGAENIPSGYRSEMMGFFLGEEVNRVFGNGNISEDMDEVVLMGWLAEQDLPLIARNRMNWFLKGLEVANMDGESSFQVIQWLWEKMSGRAFKWNDRKKVLDLLYLDMHNPDSSLGRIMQVISLSDPNILNHKIESDQLFDRVTIYLNARGFSIGKEEVERAYRIYKAEQERRLRELSERGAAVFFDRPYDDISALRALNWGVETGYVGFNGRYHPWLMLQHLYNELAWLAKWGEGDSSNKAKIFAQALGKMFGKQPGGFISPDFDLSEEGGN